MRDGDACKTKCSSIADTFGERVQDAAENKHLHRGAFKLCLKLFRMDAEKREDFVRSLNLYIYMCGEQGLWETHEGDFVDKAEAAKDVSADAVETNVTRLNGGITKLEPEDANGERKPRHGRPPEKTGHKFGQPRDGAPLGDGAFAPGSLGSGESGASCSRKKVTSWPAPNKARPTESGTQWSMKNLMRNRSP